MDENLSGSVDSTSAVSNMYGNHNSQNADINHGHPVPSVALKNSMLALPPQANVTPKSQSLSSVNTTNGTGRKYQCKMCPQIFMHKSAMQHHSREAHKGDIKPYQCQQCLKSFSSNHQLIQHIRIHTGEKPYKCSYCDRRFKQLSHVQQHTRLHTGERPYKCHLPECARAFIQLSNLQQHLRNHDSQVERAKNRPFVCSICGKNFATESNLRTHNSKQHVSLIGVTFPQTCPVCHKSCINGDALMEHMNVVHKNTNASGDTSKRKLSNHQCPLCGKTYVNEGSLRKHIATHPETSSIASAPLRMWPCTVCQNVFTQETGLLHHMETMRTDPRHQFAAQYLLSRAAAERREKPPNTSSPLSLPTSTSVAISNVHLQPLNVMSTCDTVMPEAPASHPPPQTGVSAINCSSNSSSDTDITTSPSATKSPLPEQLASHQQHF